MGLCVYIGVLVFICLSGCFLSVCVCVCVLGVLGAAEREIRDTLGVLRRVFCVVVEPV